MHRPNPQASSSAARSSSQPRSWSLMQVLGVLAAVALVVVAVRIAPRSAQATDEPALGLVNPIDQRNAMIAELKELNDRLERIEERLNTATSRQGEG